MNFTTNYKPFPAEFTKFKTDFYRPGAHFKIPKKWDNFTIHVPGWKSLLGYLFKEKKNLKFLELGTGNGLCSNFLAENFDCTIDTVDLSETNTVEVSGSFYEVSTIHNLKPFLDSGQVTFYKLSTKEFFLQNNQIYDFIYVDASHDKDWVLFDAIQSFSRLKVNGLMIFDDYGWGECSIGIDAFLTSFEDNFTLLAKDWQVAIIKTKDF